MIPALLFVGAVFLTNIYTATAILIVALFGLVAFYAVVEKRLHKMHFGTAVAALVLGGLTLAVRDPLFIKYKPTVIYAVFALIITTSHFIGERVVMQRLGHKTLQMPEELWRRINMAWALFFAGCAGLNAVLAVSLSDEHWALVKTFGFTGLMFVFLLAHIPFVHRYLPEDGKPG